MDKNRFFDRRIEGRLPTEGRPQNDNERNPADSSFAILVHCLNTECVADREVIFKRELQQKQGTRHSFRQKANKNRNYHKENPKTFEERLDLTIFWLEETFPKLFAADDYIPLDICILGALKKDYKKKCFKQVCTKSLVIDAALALYKKSYGYLECLQEGAVRYNLKGEPSGIVTKEEYEAARKILKTL